MNKSELQAALLKEHSRRQCDLIVQSVKNSEKRFAHLFSFFSSKDALLSQRAAWPLTYIIEAHPHLLKPYHKQVTDLLLRDRHPAIRRNLLRALRFVDLDDELAGPLIDICIDYALDSKEPNAVRANAIELYTKISLLHPQLITETLSILNEIDHSHEASVRAAVRKARRALKH